MEIFVPKSVIYPAAGKDQILVSGEVDGEIRNAPLVNDADLAARFRFAASARDKAIKVAHEEYAAAREKLDAEASEKAVELFNEAQTPKKVEEE